MNKEPISQEQKKKARAFMEKQLKRTPEEQIAAMIKQHKTNRSKKKK